MKARTVREIVAGIEAVRVDGDASVAVTDVTLDSRRVRPGALFAALPGGRQDGLAFVAEAVTRGAPAILAAVSRQPEGDGATWITAADPRAALALVARNFHGRPDDALAIVGVTGTNGKTTVAHLVFEILRDGGHPCGLIGTVGHRIADREIAADRTTPEAPDLYRMLSEMRAAGCLHAVMEISSHGLSLERVGGLSVAVAVFTNLTRDHLDFHGTLDAYAEAKRRLFSERLREDGVAVAGADDARAGMMLEAAPVRARRMTFGFPESCDVRIESCHADLGGTDVTLRVPGPAGSRRVSVRTPLPGRVGALNLAAAVAAASGLGLDTERAAIAAARFPGVPGRFERIDRGQDFAVIVDYAHTPDALENVLGIVEEMRPARILTVFGCGGDRDRSKRAPMGEAAIRHSDVVLLTSDNPRTEDPRRILADAEAGILSNARAPGRYSVLPDRREAICAAIAAAQAGDVVLIAGKGHETVQILADRTIPFDDRKVAAEALSVRQGRPA